MKILIYGNRKQDDEFYDTSTPEKELAAYLAVFKILDEDWDVYCEVEGTLHEALYKAAKAGDGNAAKRLLTARRDYEYENVQTGEVIDPLVSTASTPQRRGE